MLQSYSYTARLYLFLEVQGRLSGIPQRKKTHTSEGRNSADKRYDPLKDRLGEPQTWPEHVVLIIAKVPDAQHVSRVRNGY